MVQKDIQISSKYLMHEPLKYCQVHYTAQMEEHNTQRV